MIPGPPDPLIPLVKFGADRRTAEHMCFTYDPADAPGGQQPWPLYKKKFGPPASVLVDRCPTESAVASCDFRKNTHSPAPNDFIEFFYAGVEAGALAGIEAMCTSVWHGQWKSLVAAAVVRQADGRRPPIAFACDTRKSVETCKGPCSPGCTAWKVSGPSLNGQPLVPDVSGFIAQQKKSCGGVVVDRCPAAGLTGRCESMSLQGNLTYTYSADRGTQQMAQSLCKQTGGTWTAP